MQTNIREISSRLDVVQNDVAKIFKEVIITIFNYYFYDFNRAADDITKSILRDEGLLQDDVKKEVKRRKDENNKLLKENQRLLKEIKRTKEILLTKAVVIGDDVNISQKVYEKAIETLDSVDTQIKITQDELGKTKEVLDTAEAGLKEIQIEAFNNYKLMANGLITETMTHELHAIVNDPNECCSIFIFNDPHELYYGEFVDWNHCISFSDQPSYGMQQEGIVIKNQTALEENRGPHVLKYVNANFREIQKQNHKKKIEDPNKLKERTEAEEYIRMIVTEARVMKCYHKLVDDGVIPEKFELKYMKEVARNLPKAVYEDCVKEEMEVLKKAGEYAGKLCNKVTMEIVKNKLNLSR